MSSRTSQAVKGLRVYGCSWAEIRARLGVTRQTAQQRWGQHHYTGRSTGMSAALSGYQCVELDLIPLRNANHVCPLKLALMYCTVSEYHKSHCLALLSEPEKQSRPQRQRSSSYGGPDTMMTSACRHLGMCALYGTETTGLQEPRQR